MKPLLNPKSLLFLTAFAFMAVTLFLGSCKTPPLPPEAPSKLPPAEPPPAEEDVYTGVASFLSMGDPEAAIQALEKAQQKDPDSRETRRLLGEVLMIAGKTREAKDIFTDLLRSNPQDTDVLYNLAMIEANELNFSKEKEILEQILKIDPTHPNANAAYGELLLKQKKLEQAEKAFAASLEKDPQNIIALIGKGNAELRQKRPREAEKTLTKAVEVMPTYPFTYVDRGKARAELGNYEGAEEDLNRAIELAPEFAWNYYDRGRLRATMGKTVEALSDFNKAIELDPNNFLAYIYRARILDGQEKYQEALKDYQQALKLNPQYPHAHLPMALLYYKTNQFNQAAESFIKVAERDQTEPAYHLLTALCYKSANREREAALYLERVLALLPRDTLFFHMARYYMQPSSDFFIVQQVNNERNRVLKTRMLFYLGAQYKLQQKTNLARTYLLEASDPRISSFIEYRLAQWELKNLRADR